jgi:DNA-binding transcriptional LysR family regulator
VPRENINDLLAFLAVARERSFTRAAAKVGVSQSALSHTIRQLETRLGIRLLTRTTRAVSSTGAGERLLESIGPHFDEIEAQVEALSELREKPAGIIRITASDYAINHVLWPKLRKFLPNYPDIKVELMLDNGLDEHCAAGESQSADIRTSNRWPRGYPPPRHWSSRNSAATLSRSQKPSASAERRSKALWDRTT